MDDEELVSPMDDEELIKEFIRTERGKDGVVIMVSEVE